MNNLDYVCLVIAVIAVLMAVLLIIWYRQKTKRTLMKIDAMLDDAVDGRFEEGVFDESRLSAIEAKFARYLSICAASSSNLTTEKDKIKALISDISHQTKTPIANILLYAQLLEEHELPEDCSTCVKALSTQAEKLNFLISALVKTSRLESGIITVIPKPEKVQKLLAAVEEQISQKAEAAGLVLEIIPTECSACFDLKWTGEALYNIVDNAVKYSQKGARIFIEAVPYELFCRIDISDNGLGIAEEEQSKIFTRFYRSAAVSDKEGVGIGLFLAREIIAAEGGYLTVSSELGKGSAFSVFLPR